MFECIVLYQMQLYCTVSDTIVLYQTQVADWLERLACNVESTGSSLVRNSYCVGTLSKFFTYNCSIHIYYCICGAEACKCTSELYVRRAISLCCIIL